MQNNADLTITLAIFFIVILVFVGVLSTIHGIGHMIQLADNLSINKVKLEYGDIKEEVYQSIIEKIAPVYNKCFNTSLPNEIVCCIKIKEADLQNISNSSNTYICDSFLIEHHGNDTLIVRSRLGR